MDVLNLNKYEILRMSLKEFNMAINYSWTTYNLRRVDLPYRNKEKEPDMKWEHDFVSKVKERKGNVSRR